MLHALQRQPQVQASLRPHPATRADGAAGLQQVHAAGADAVRGAGPGGAWGEDTGQGGIQEAVPAGLRREGVRVMQADQEDRTWAAECELQTQLGLKQHRFHQQWNVKGEDTNHKTLMATDWGMVNELVNKHQTHRVGPAVKEFSRSALWWCRCLVPRFSGWAGTMRTWPSPCSQTSGSRRR